MRPGHGRLDTSRTVAGPPARSRLAPTHPTGSRPARSRLFGPTSPGCPVPAVRELTVPGLTVRVLTVPRLTVPQPLGLAHRGHSGTARMPAVPTLPAGAVAGKNPRANRVPASTGNARAGKPVVGESHQRGPGAASGRRGHRVLMWRARPPASGHPSVQALTSAETMGRAPVTANGPAAGRGRAMIGSPVTSGSPTSGKAWAAPVTCLSRPAAAHGPVVPRVLTTTSAGPGPARASQLRAGLVRPSRVRPSRVKGSRVRRGPDSRSGSLTAAGSGSG
jgi:hypothetical protein